ncbi:MAG TPA: TlpA disulfide reductase family protein, partial [Streptomyces sp.]|nr:TlpA disulfide reductase family protein [Streptomyces sp.]
MSWTRSFPRRPALLIAMVAAAASVLAGCGEGKTGSSSGDKNFVQGTGQITKVPSGERQAAPDLAGKGVDGERLDLSEHKGKVVVLNVWGSWCRPCRDEAPNLAKVEKETDDKDVQFIGINTRDLDRANAESFERNYEVE